jgi:uncharacterized protein
MLIDPITAGLAAASGVLVGFLLAMFGGGGSVLAAPLLIYLVGINDPHIAIGTSALAVAANASISLMAQARAGQVKWPCASVFAAAGLTGSVIGSTIARQIDGQHLLLLFALAMAVIALSMLRTPKSTGDPEVTLNNKLIMRLAPVGLVTGLAAGFFGIGGGFLIVPGLMLATGMTLGHAAASSLLSVAVFGLGTGASYALARQVNWLVAACLVAGGVVGGFIGLRVGRRLATNPQTGRKVFAGFILLAAAYVAARSL